MPTSACCSAITSGVAMGQSTSSLITPSSTETGNVSTGTYAGRVRGFPVRRSNSEPWRGHSTVQRSGSTSPSSRIPSSCEQRSSMASSSPLQLKTPISRSSHSTSRCTPGGRASRGQMSMTGLKSDLGSRYWRVVGPARPGYAAAGVEVTTLEDGAQPAEAVAERLVAWLAAARSSLDLALYDVRLPGPVGDAVRDALQAAMARGVRVRLAYNDGQPAPGPRPFEPPPPSTRPAVLEATGIPLREIPGWRHLMHHKYVVRDELAVWTGSTNWTLDSWTRQENVLATVAHPLVAAAYARDFTQLWDKGKVGVSGNFDAPAAAGARPWFTPGRGRELSHRIAERIGAARPRVRIATPLVTAAPILAALNEALSEGRDIAGICDATQVRQVFHQWSQNPRSEWKAPLLARALTTFRGKPSTPYAPGSLHDFMHAKVTVADDVVFLGSFNLSRSGETNAENVLEMEDPALAERLAAWIDHLRSRYPDGI